MGQVLHGSAKTTYAIRGEARGHFLEVSSLSRKARHCKINDVEPPCSLEAVEQRG